MKNLFLAGWLLLFTTGPVLAQNLPPPLIIKDNPPVEIPGEIVLEMQKNAAVCLKKSQQFTLNLKHVAIMDVSDDGRLDYILSSLGYLCNGQNAAFAHPEGGNYYVFIHQRNGRYLRIDIPFRAFAIEIDRPGTKSGLVFKTGCGTPPSAARTGETTIRWDQNIWNFDMVSRNKGCK